MMADNTGHGLQSTRNRKTCPMMGEVPQFEQGLVRTVWGSIGIVVQLNINCYL
jgi:hypothetical protein